MVAGNSYKCSSCSRDLSKASPLNNPYDQQKDLIVCVQCYNLEQDKKYKNCKITHNNLKNPDGITDGSSELIIVYNKKGGKKGEGNKCLECQKDLPTDKELFCDVQNCAQSFVDKHYEWTKTYSTSGNSDNNYRTHCKVCETELLSRPDKKIDFKILKELNKHLPQCPGKKSEKPNKERREDLPEGTIQCNNCNKKVQEAFKWEDKSYCHACQNQMEANGTAPWKKDDEDNNQNAKKWGKDFGQLKPLQRVGRTKTSNNWDEKRAKGYNRWKTCRYCPQTFEYDKSLEFLPAKQKVEAELKAHETSCPKKNDQAEQQRLKQIKWEKRRKQKGSPFYTCRKCWGKVCLDKNIDNWTQAKKLAYHQKEECWKEGKKKVPILFSPNTGGNEHAPLNYAEEVNENDLIMEQDNETEVVYQEQSDNSYNPSDKSNKGLYISLAIGGVLAVGIIAWLLMKNKKEK